MIASLFPTQIHSSPTDNLMLIVYANGSVWQNYRMRVKGPCEIDLRRFPFDTQTCRLMIESYSYHSQVCCAEAYTKWRAGHSVYASAGSNQHRSRSWAACSCLILFWMGGTKWRENYRNFVTHRYPTYKHDSEYPNGRWHALEAVFIFRRQYGFFILQVSRMVNSTPNATGDYRRTSRL
jgi:hypothetical protein